MAELEAGFRRQPAPTVGRRRRSVAVLVVLGLALPLWVASLARAQDTSPDDDYFGAIAYSPPEGIYGYSYDQLNREQAERFALLECQTRGGQSCRLLVWFANACGAIAQSQQRFGYAWADRRSRAEAQAVASCGAGCVTIESVCTRQRKR